MNSCRDYATKVITSAAAVCDSRMQVPSWPQKHHFGLKMILRHAVLRIYSFLPPGVPCRSCVLLVVSLR